MRARHSAGTDEPSEIEASSLAKIAEYLDDLSGYPGGNRRDQDLVPAKLRKYRIRTVYHHSGYEPSVIVMSN